MSIFTYKKWALPYQRLPHRQLMYIYSHTNMGLHTPQISIGVLTLVCENTSVYSRSAPYFIPIFSTLYVLFSELFIMTFGFRWMSFFHTESFSFTCRTYNTVPPTSAQIPPQVLLSAMLYVTLRCHKTEASRALRSRFSGPQQAWNLFQVLLPPASH